MEDEDTETFDPRIPIKLPITKVLNESSPDAVKLPGLYFIREEFDDRPRVF